jgi:hypothetical protein
MRIANRVHRVRLFADVLAAAVVCAGVGCMLSVAPAFAQDARTGVSHPPDPATITTSDADSGAAATSPSVPATSLPATKPSAAIPAASSETVYGPYVPYRAPGTPAESSAVNDPDANIVTAATAGSDDRMLQSAAQSAAAKADIDAGIVTHVFSRAGEIPEGTLVKVRLREDMSTMTTKAGTKFTAEVTEPVMRDGVVIVPVGSVLDGRVTWVRGGERIGGAAAIHLEPRTITLPDGAQDLLRARVIDTDRWDSTKVDEEGTILRRDTSKKTIAAMSLAVGGPLAAGAVIGGVPGALIGAGVGAGAGTVVWLKQDRQAELPKDLRVVFSLTEPMSITPVSAAVVPLKSGMPGGE